MFGLDSTLGALAQAPADDPAVQVLHLVEAVRGFEHPTEPSDDLTILAVRYGG
jgi:serine phosphatase RsbU (regulator of sigma subunit)